ncbi:MAG: ATP synthase F1 subunit epsilon [Prosthecobacter sp.]|nr:ATP synthase F1 subunit epsilon [Prosthecobacter sp.]
MPIHLEIVTPEARIFPGKDADGHLASGEVDSVVLPGFDGELGVLPSHAPLVTSLQCGELRLIKAGKVTELAVGEGLVEITGSYVRVLTDMAVGCDEIDEKAVEEALERAKQSLESLKQGEKQEEVAAVMAMIQRSTAQLHLKRKRKSI